jgi:hypothetical protein
MVEYDGTTRRVWDSEEDPTLVDEILEDKGWPRQMSMQLKSWIHSLVCDNARQLEEYRV